MNGYKAHLAKDPVLRPLVEKIVLQLPEGPPEPAYPALVRSIIFQQLSVKAAGTIYARFLHLFPETYPDPTLLLNMPDENLRQAGLSRQKATYVKAVAAYFLRSNRLENDWSVIPSNEIMKAFTQIKGVGTWTVQMLLLGALQRPDIFPLNDQGIRTGMSDLYQLPAMPPKELDQHLEFIAKNWSPFRSFACRYIWSWKDTEFL